MQKRCQTEDIETWFDKESYKDVPGFGKAEWFIALSYRLNFRRLDNQILSNVLEPEQRWAHFYQNGQPSLENINSMVSHYNNPAVVDPAIAVEEIETADVVNTSLPFHEQGIRVLVVDPDAPDKELLNGFVNWLTNLRKTHPLHIHVPGPKSLNVQITEAHIRSWTNKHILACLDIDLWAKIHGMNKLAYEDLYDIVWDERDEQVGAKDWAIGARETAEEALKATRLLAYARKGLKNK
jgi:hypothetical protein